MITADLFKLRVGREPQDDDLERCNCPAAGQIGHFQCGWDEQYDLPYFESGRTNVKVVIDTAPRNFYEPPFVNFAGNSGTFWRCPHGETRFGAAGCRACAVANPLGYFRTTTLWNWLFPHKGHV